MFTKHQLYASICCIIRVCGRILAGYFLFLHYDYSSCFSQENVVVSFIVNLWLCW